MTMSLSSEIGGFFELELKSGSFLHDDAVLLNSGRNCFEYVLTLKKPTKVYLPKFTCDVMLEPLAKLDIEYSFYRINDELEIADDIQLQADELIVYTNYFGIKDDYSRQLSGVYGDSLILDCSQAYYFEPLDQGHTFYSPRKFFGVSDGGCLYTNERLSDIFPVDVSIDRMSHLVKRIEYGAEAAYDDFKSNDADLEGAPIKRMSALTRKILGNVDFENVKNVRKENAKFLDDALGQFNSLDIDLGNSTCPMVYPLLINKPGLREALISNKVFVAAYWPNVLEWCGEDELEYFLTKSILPLPIDQRYDVEDMKRIVTIIEELV